MGAVIAGEPARVWRAMSEAQRDMLEAACALGSAAGLVLVDSALRARGHDRAIHGPTNSINVRTIEALERRGLVAGDGDRWTATDRAFEVLQGGKNGQPY